MNKEFKKIGLICKPDAPEIAQTIQSVHSFLNEMNLSIYIDAESAKYIAAANENILNQQALVEQSDLIISIGGDGTLLGAARALVNSNVPLIGINLGRLGFLVDISPDEMQRQIKEILNGHYHEEKRIILSAKVIRKGELIYQQSAFNDVVIHRAQSPGVIEIDTSVDGVLLNSQRSDGLIIATPTGSTAYSLSGGGPLMQPSMNALILVPVNPHTLSNRPIVIDGDSKVDISFSQRNYHQAQLSCDNILAPTILEGDTVSIQRHEQRIHLLHPPEHNFFEILRVKLNWGRTS